LHYSGSLGALTFFITDQVFTRYGLQKLFGPDCLALTSDQSPLYPDLPSNMVCTIIFMLKFESRNLEKPQGILYVLTHVDCQIAWASLGLS
jgi:hypothetical protein